MKNLYAKVVLFLIKPALELHLCKTKDQRYKEVDETVFNCIALGGSNITKGLDYIYGLKRLGK